MKNKLLWSLPFLALLLFEGCKSSQIEEDYELTPRGFLESLVPNGDILELDSFEYGLNWDANTDSLNDLSSHCQISNFWKSEGNFSMECTFNKGSSPEETEASFIFNNSIETFWNNSRFIAIEIYNPNKDCLKIGIKLDSYKSNFQICPPGHHLLLININDYGESLKATEEIKYFTVNKLSLYVEGLNNVTSNCNSFFADNIRLLMDNSNQVISAENSSTLQPVDSE